MGILMNISGHAVRRLMRALKMAFERNKGQRWPWTFVSILVFFFSVSTVTAFNVDVDSKVIHEAPRRSCAGDCMFGFSVAQHREQGQSWLLVGAPTADSNQPGVIKGGGVFKCPPDAPGQCDLIPFDTKGNTLAPTGQQYDKKSGQWFGSLVRSSGGDNGVVLACAPRYVWYSRNFKRREPIGTCYTARNNFNEFFEYSPCRTRKWGYHRQGSCQAGLGAAIADQNQVYVGAVGSWYWQGQVFSQKLLSLRDQHKTAEGSPSDDDSYLGYSVATGEFNGDGDNADVVVGMPRGANLTGKVVLYTSSLKNIFNMSGDQIGAYYGYSVASGDLNGDGLDDVIVGAPMWTNYEVMGKYETGRVYVYYQPFEERKFHALNGEGHKARFGLSVACAGNINLDGKKGKSKGIEDLVVGAPYDGPDHQGAVYIYLGTHDGINQKYAQRIYGKDVNSQLRTFGWSLSAGMDLDNNNYPDLLVGAYESNNAVYLKSAPVVHLDSEVQFLVSGKQINIARKNCNIRDGTPVPCVDVEVTLTYDGVGVPDTIDLEMQYILDAKKQKKKRLFFLDHEGESERNETITVTRASKKRISFKVHLPASGILDKLTSIDIQVRYSLAEKNNGRYYGRQRKELAPVLGHDDRMATDTVSIQKDCGHDNVCVPNLSVSVSHADAFIWGSEDKMEITADIYNDGEDSFNSFLYLTLPKEINYISANASTSSVPILCSPPSESNNRTLECDIGNPLPTKTKATVRIFLQPAESTEAEQEMYLSEYVFYMSVNSSNQEHPENVEDNQKYIHIPLSVTTEWKVTGKSEPATLEYNISDPLTDKYLVEDQLGPEVIHIYDVKNKGPATIKEAEVFIMWPSFTKDDHRHLLYLLGVSNDQKENVVCQSIPNINPLYIKTTESQGYAQALREAQERDEELGINIESSYYASSSSKKDGYSIGGSSRTGDGYYSSGGSGGYYQQSGSGSRYNYGSSSSSNSGNSYSENGRISSGGSSYSSTKNTQTTYSSSSSSISSSGAKSSGPTSGWKLLENGTYIRIYDSRSTNNQKSGGSGSTYSTSLRGGETKLTGQGALGGGVDQNLNTIIGAAQGPGDYHGTMKKSELEKEAGGPVFSSNNQETRHQVENTRYQGGSVTSSNSYGSGSSSNYDGSSSSTTNYGTRYGGTEYDDSDDYDYDDSSYRSGGRSGSSSSSRNSFSSYDASNSKVYTEGGNTRYEEGSYFDLDHRDVEESNKHSSSGSYSSSKSSSSSSGASSSSSSTSATTGRWVWSETSGKWEWSEASTTSEGDSADASTTVSSEGHDMNLNNYDEGSSDSGWIMLPNGTQVRTQSSWSSSSYSSSNDDPGRRKSNGRRGRPVTQSGSSDSGWVKLENGTMVRRQKTWSRTQYETSYGGVQLNPEDKDELAAKLGHGEIHDNEKPWADLDELQRKVDAKAKALPSNIEPGFEDQYLRDHHRVKRQLPYGGAFDAELNCDPESCTMIRCTVGPLKKNEGVVFKVRSRLFKQTQVDKYAKVVQIASKLVTRITKLPYMANPMAVSYQTFKVKTEVFPSEMGEGSIPWWVWLLAAVLGLALLAVIVVCLKKCGFFKRKRPDNSPEREPLNGYH